MLRYASLRFHPQMLDWVADEVSRLVVAEGIPPGEIAILAPYLSDALRFALALRLERYGIIPVSPPFAVAAGGSRHALPADAGRGGASAWGIAPSQFDVAQMLMQAIEGMDSVRASN